MRGVAKHYKWIKNAQPMTIAEIATHEDIHLATMKCWFSRYKEKLSKIRNKSAEFKRRGKDSRKKLFTYRDGKLYTAIQIQKKEPHLSIATIRNRYRRCKPGDLDFEAIFAPNGTPGCFSSNRITKKDLSGLGPRRDINSIPGPSEFEKQLWGR